MGLLFRAVIQAKRRFFLFLFAILALVGTSIADQVEMVTIGMIMNNGADFFSLFGDGEKVKKSDIEQVWKTLDIDGKEYVTKHDTTRYMGKQKKVTLINKFLARLKLFYNKNVASFQMAILMLLCIGIFKAFLLFYSRFFTQILAIKVSRDLRQKYFKHIQTLSMDFYNSYNIGSLSTRVMADSNQIALSINSMIINYFQTPFKILSTLSLCFILSWELSLVIFLGIPFTLIPIRVLTKKVRKITRRLQKNQENFASVLIDFLSGIKTIKIFSMEDFTFKKYCEQNDYMEKLETKTSRYDMLTRPILHFVTMSCLVSVLFIGLYWMHVPLPDLIVFCGLLHLLYEPIKKFSEENANIQKGVVAAERMFDVLSQKPKIVDSEDAISMTDFHHSIMFDKVWFRYKDDWVLKDVSFTVRKGETIAIIGTTGSGKSTILSLIPRLYEIEKGNIFIDGIPISRIKQKDLRALLSFVPQAPFLFNETVSTNISYGNQISKELIQEAAISAHADEFIQELPGKYDSILAEGGKNLSSGQQQRIAIARALVKKSPILILDEATASLDSVSELRIKQAIQRLHGKLTQIVVAHRLSTIEYADRIIVIEKGRKISEGTKDELFKSCKTFNSMWNAGKLESVLS